MSTVHKTVEGLEAFGIEGGDLAPGVADLAFTIPRELFDDQLGSFAKELGFISRLMLQYSEAVTGKAEPVRLEGLSSSIPTVSLLADAQTIAAFAGLISAFLAAWEKVEKIRKIRAELAEMGLKRNTFDDLTEQIKTTITTVVEETTVVSLENFKGDPGRKNELQNALRRDTAKLFARIERGMTIQFRASPDKNAGDGNQKALETVNRLGRILQFPKVDGDPILLTNGELLEDEDVVSQVLKKTTSIRTLSKKATKQTNEDV